jgi:hypothetical protein
VVTRTRPHPTSYIHCLFYFVLQLPPTSVLLSTSERYPFSFLLLYFSLSFLLKCTSLSFSFISPSLLLPPYFTFKLLALLAACPASFLSTMSYGLSFSAYSNSIVVFEIVKVLDVLYLVYWNALRWGKSAESVWIQMSHITFKTLQSSRAILYNF